jgi:hypothetical protein
VNDVREHADQSRSKSDEGSSLVEVIVSMGIMATLAAGLLSMTAIALTQSENQGHLAARTAEYAQDKMEQLLVLSYGDDTSDTRVFPATNAGGTGLEIGGSDDPDAPVAGYVDYLDARGNLLASGGGAPAGWFYVRAWEIVQVSPTLKEVRVTTTVARAIGRTMRPAATLVTLKTFPF